MNNEEIIKGTMQYLMEIAGEAADDIILNDRNTRQTRRALKQGKYLTDAEIEINMELSAGDKKQLLKLINILTLLQLEKKTQV